MTDFMTEIDSTRGQFIRNSGKGALALVAGGSVFAMAEGVSFGQTDGDIAIATLAATAELLAVDFYTRAINSGLFRGATRTYLTNARRAERAHYSTLAGLLGSSAPRDLRFKYPAGTFRSASRIVNLGVTAETAFVGAYMTGVEALSSNELKLLAAQVGANEGTHLGFLLNAQGRGRTLPALAPKVSAERATQVVGSFIDR